jgi:hypothetical protein
MSDTFVLDTKVLDELARTLDKRTERVLAMAAFELESEAKMVADAWPARDTGAMISSIGVAGAGGDAEKAASQAASDNPDAEITTLPKPEKGAFHIGPQVNYAPYVEYGTYKMGARPFLQPAFEFIRKVYSDAEVWKREFLKDLK